MFLVAVDAEVQSPAGLTRLGLSYRTGKLYHPAHPKNGDGNASWSPLPQQFSCTDQPVGPPGTYCNPDAPGCTDIGTKTAPNPRWCSVDLPINGSGPDGPDLADAKTVADGLMKLQYAIATRARTVGELMLSCCFRGGWTSAFEIAVFFSGDTVVLGCGVSRAASGLANASCLSRTLSHNQRDSTRAPPCSPAWPPSGVDPLSLPRRIF